MQATPTRLVMGMCAVFCAVLTGCGDDAAGGQLGRPANHKIWTQARKHLQPDVLSGAGMFWHLRVRGPSGGTRRGQAMRE